MEQVSKSVYVETNAKCITVPFGESYFIDRGANPGCIVTDKGIVQIDTTKNPMYALNWMKSVKEISNKPFVYTVNTDHHLDHIMCNYCFDAPVITHALTKVEVDKFVPFSPQKLIPFLYSKELYNMLRQRDDTYLNRLMQSYNALDKEFRQPYENLHIVPAEITFDSRLTLYLGNLHLEILSVGGHAPGSILVLVPEEKVLFAGDSVFNDCMPNMAQANTEQWLQNLAMIESMDVKIIVPGHGHPCDKQPLKKLAQYIRELREKVATFKDRGYSRDQVVAEIDMTSFWPLDNELGWTKERLRDWGDGNTGRVFDELQAISH